MLSLGSNWKGGGYVTRYEYDFLSNPTKVIDSLGNQTVTSYDLLNRVTNIAQPHPVTVGQTFDTQVNYTDQAQGWKVSTTNPAGETVDTQLDMLGRVVRVSGATPTQTIAYWTDGNLKSVADELGRTTDYNFDPRGRLTSVVAPQPSFNAARPTTSYQYTVDSLVSSVSDPLGRVSSYTYDAGGRVSMVSEPDPDGAGALLAASTSYTRDGLGNVLSTTDAFGQKNSITSRDAWFRTLTASDPSGALTTFTYDVFGNTLSLTDPLGNQTQYGYNKINELVSENKVGTGARYLYYDAEGNLRRQLDRNGRNIYWEFDRLDRVTREAWAVGGTYEYIYYAYDSADRLISVNDYRPNGTDFQFTYDARGQLQNERQYHELMAKNILFDRDYDAVGNRTKLEANIGGSISGSSIVGGVWDMRNSYTYDGLDRLTYLTQSNRTGTGVVANTVAPKHATFAYDTASQLTDMRRYSATTASTASLEVHSRLAYDLAGRLTNITHGKTEIAAGQNWTGTSAAPASLGASNLLAGYFLTYDQDNRLASFSSWRDAAKTSYTYNTTDQLTAASSTQIAGLTLPFALPVAESYNLDSNGNRKSSGGAAQSAPGTHNRLQTDGTYNYTYDNEGNTTRRTLIASGAVTDYTWDHRNRMTSVTEKVSATGATTKKTEFYYDVFDQRVARRLDADGNGTWDQYESYVWADGQEVLRYVDSDGAASTQPFRLANRYLWGAAVDQLLSDEQYTGNSGPAITASTGSVTAGNTLWALSDHLGSVRDISDNNGVVRQHLVFDSFGRRVREVDYSTSGAVISSNDPAAVDELIWLHRPRLRHRRRLAVQSSSLVRRQHRQMAQPRPYRLQRRGCEPVSVCREWSGGCD